MEKPIIGVDLDDSLWKFVVVLNRYYNERYFAKFEHRHYTTFNIHEVWGVSEEEANRRIAEFIESPAHRTIELMEDAKEVLTMLAELCDQVAITARGHVHAHIAHALIDRLLPNLFSNVHFLGHHGHGGKKSKGEQCVEIKAALMVEDGLHNAFSVADHGIPVLLMNQPWNQGPLPPLITRVANWKEVYYYASRILKNPR